MIKFEDKKRNLIVDVPTSEKEITLEDLQNLSADVKVSKYYCLIALYQTVGAYDLSTIVNKSSRDIDVKVSAYLIKCGEDCKLDAQPGDKIITSRSDLERSIHVSTPSSISMSNIRRMIEDNTNLRTLLTKGVDDEGKLVKNIVGVEFKLIPATCIYASISKGNFKDRFKHTIQGS